MIRITGIKCSKIVVFEFLFSVKYVFEDVGFAPWFSAVYINSEYPTVKNLINLIGIITDIDCLIVPVISRISLIKLILGGAAMFALHAKNHHIDDSGNTAVNPFVSEILRLCLDSYVIYAM